MNDRHHKAAAFRSLLARFARDEEGGIIIFTLVLFTVMLVVAGMAVDFMRFESERAQLQSVSDRAVLAAAELDQTLDSEDVVVDFFRSQGLEDKIVGTPIVTDTGNTRSVRVNSAVDVNTFYLRLIGIDTLQAPAVSAATEGVGKVEISLVLDISGSMRYGGSGSDGKFGDMQDAAIAFAAKVLDPKYDGQVSLNIVPYAGSTNPGRVVFNYINGVRYPAFDINGDPFPNESSCVEFAAADWTTSGPPGDFRPQVPLFMNWAIDASVMDWGWCPHDRSSIRYGIKDLADVEAFIKGIGVPGDGIRMHDGTGTHYAMKWGLAALDPTMQPAFDLLADAGELDSSFRNRPAPYSDGETRKIIVLMTDGAITDQFRPIEPMDPQNLTTYAIPKTPLTWRPANLANFYAACDMAKHPSRDIEVFTVAFETSGDGATEMENCASESSKFFPNVQGSNLTDVFEDIAKQIIDLRLSL